jgi:hypothetical protein
MMMRTIARAAVLCAAAAVPSAVPSAVLAADGTVKVASKTADEQAADLVAEAEEAMAKKLYPVARTALERVVKVYPSTSSAGRARTLLRSVPNERGRLLVGFDSEAEIGEAPHVQLVTDPKIVPYGEGCVHIKLQSQRTRFPMIPAEKLSRLKSISFWVWSEAPIVGMTGTTYICLHTDQGNDYLMQKFQLKGDGQWHLIELNAGGFKRRTNEQDRTFTSIGFWNPSPEIRDFLVDDIRVIEADPPKSGSMLNAPAEGKGLPPLTPPK